MYLPVGNTVVALEADTGKVIWQREVAGGPQAGAVSRRGVGYFPGDRNTPERIIVTGGRSSLLAFDAATGKPSEGFGTNGEVDMVRRLRRDADDLQERHHGRRQRQRSAASGRPATRARSTRRTGKKLWEFHTVPRPGEVGHETWLDDGWKRSIGHEHWGVLHDGRRAARHRSTCRSPVRPRTTGAAIVRATTCSPTRSSPSTSRPASTSGTSRPCITTSGTRHAVAAGARRHQAERPDDSRARVGRQDRLHVHPRSHDRQADLRRRGAAGAEGRRARRVVFADAAVSGEAAAAGARRASRRKTW